MKSFFITSLLLLLAQMKRFKLNYRHDLSQLWACTPIFRPIGYIQRVQGFFVAFCEKFKFSLIEPITLYKKKRHKNNQFKVWVANSYLIRFGSIRQTLEIRKFHCIIYILNVNKLNFWTFITLHLVSLETFNFL